MDLGNAQREPIDSVDAVQQPVEGGDGRIGREGHALDLAVAKVDLDRLKRIVQTPRRGAPDMACIAGADLGDEGRKLLRMFVALRPSGWIVERNHQKRPALLGKASRDFLERRQRRQVIVRPDQIR